MPRSNVMVAVVAIIENDKGEILLLKRSPDNEESPNFWEDCGGRLKQSEIPELGLRREIREESGLDDIEIVKPLTVFHTFRNGISSIDNWLICIAYWCKTKSSKVLLSNEHCDYQWVIPEQAINIVDRHALKQYIKIYLEEKQLAREINLLTYEKERLEYD